MEIYYEVHKKCICIPDKRLTLQQKLYLDTKIQSKILFSGWTMVVKIIGNKYDKSTSETYEYILAKALCYFVMGSQPSASVQPPAAAVGVVRHDDVRRWEGVLLENSL